MGHTELWAALPLSWSQAAVLRSLPQMALLPSDVYPGECPLGH